MTLLAVDTSTTRGSVAVLSGETLLFHEIFESDRSHSSTLFGVLEEVRRIAPRVDTIAIGLGPGSYAGIRISIAAALGIHLTTGAELVGIPSVAALDTGTPQYVAIGDARRETFYWTKVEGGICTEGPLLLSEADLQNRVAASGLPVFTTDPAPLFPSAQIALPNAAMLTRIAAAGMGITARGNLEPIYLREPHITYPKRSPVFFTPK